MNFNELPGKIRKTFNEKVIARIARRTNKNGSHLTIVTKSGARYWYVLTGMRYVPYVPGTLAKVVVPVPETSPLYKMGYTGPKATNLVVVA